MSDRLAGAPAAGTDRLATGQLDQRVRRGPTTALVVYHRDGMSTFPLREGSDIVVGRDEPADLAVADASLSRVHARFEVRDGAVFVEDLGSTNGTRVNGEPVTRQRVRAGDEVLLGGLCVSIHSLAAGPPAEGLTDHETFGRLLEHEARRARAFGRPVSLLLVRRGPDSSIGRWFPELRGMLRGVDVAAAYAVEIVEVLLPESSSEAARQTAERVVTELGPDSRCAVGTLPGAAATANELLGVCLETLHRCSAATPVRAPAAEGEPRSDAESPVVLSAPMRELFRLVRQVAPSTIPVLVYGETGSGKEVVARAIHRHSARAAGPLRCLNCGAIPEHLVESALFGHERGAFTGAEAQKQGIFELADGGTVFLDEIGELSASAQVALLRVLETMCLVRVGGADEIEVDVRVVAATHRDLGRLCEERRFRVDLLYRLNTMELRLPPLRERLVELEALAGRFLVVANRANAREIAGISPEALEAMRLHAWPGNVRELRNVIERAVVIAAGSAITLDDLPEAIRRLGRPAPPAGSRTDSRPPEPDDPGVDFKTRVRRFEAELIERALLRCDHNKSAAARHLRIPLRTLMAKIKRYGIRRRADGAGSGAPGTVPP